MKKLTKRLQRSIESNARKTPTTKNNHWKCLKKEYPTEGRYRFDFLYARDKGGPLTEGADNIWILCNVTRFTGIEHMHAESATFWRYAEPIPAAARKVYK